MKLAIILAIVLVFIAGCTSMKTTPNISGTEELALNADDIHQLGIITNGVECQTDKAYSNIIDSSLGQYSYCNFSANNLNTDIVIELQKFSTYGALDGSYQYSSSHLYSVEGLISENDFGDKSRFRLNNEHDYGGEFNEPGVYFYHLWICKNEYLIHITSGGRNKEAKEYIAKIGNKILSKFE